MQQPRETTGTRLREPHAVSGQGLKYALADEASQLASEARISNNGHTAKTLAKTDQLRVTLVHLPAGSTVNPRARAGAASLQVLSGELSIGVGGPGQLGVNAGELVILSENLRDEIRAVADSAFLITVAWEQGAGAWDLEEDQKRH